MELVSYNDPSENSTRLPPLQKRSNDQEVKYTIGQNQHSLPPRNALKANLQIQTGVIDSWPAHSANQRPSNMQLSLTKYNSLVISNCQAEGKPELTPKPKFLENLEKFLQRELRALSCINATETSEARLQAYREVFEYLLEEFKTYKPLLASIKNEYEMMLAYQREKIRELEPLKQMLVTLADQCDHKLMQYRDEEKTEIKILKDEKKRLIDMITQLKQEKHALQVQVDKLQNELVLEHEKFRNEQDKKKLLIIDLNDLRFQQEEAKLAEMKREKKLNADGNPIDEDSSQDDPVTLKIALRVCRQNLTDAMKRLTRMEADYNDVIPKRDYVALEANFNQIKKDYESLDKEFKLLKQENTNSKDYVKQLETKLSDLSQELEETKGNYTPRPDWERAATIIDDGSDKWKDIITNKSSVQLLDTILQEFHKNSNVPEYFNGLGLTHDVPAHLRYEGKVKNINLNKKDSCAIIKDTLEARTLHNLSDKEDGMAQFLIDHLEKKYMNEAYEYSYSLNQALDKYPNNELIQFFAGVLYGQTDENIYFYEKKVIESFQEYLKTKEEENDFILKTVLRDVIKGVFPRKSLEQIEGLIKLADEDLENSSDSTRIEYNNLFNEDLDGKCGHFLTTFKTMLRDSKQIFIKQIMDAIGNISLISSVEFKRVINAIDDSISETDTNKIVNWCFNNEKQIDMETLKKKLENGCLFNYPKVLNIN